MGDGANAKSIAGGLMSRTDFAHNFSLLSETVQLHYREHPDEFVRLALESAELGASTGGERVFRNSVERGLAGSRVTTEVELTRRDWLVNITQGRDLLKNWRHLRPDEQALVNQQAEAVHGSLGALGATNNEVGPADNRVRALYRGAAADASQSQDRAAEAGGAGHLRPGRAAQPDKKLVYRRK
jgi:hypothetical protein